MSLAPWQICLSKALETNRSQPHSRYLQLATISLEGFPSNRTVVFRGFFADTNQLKIITDARSEKISHLETNPRAECCWYFTETREQFRLQGKIKIVTSTEENSVLAQERILTWQNISDAARLQFTWAHPKHTKSDLSHEINSNLNSQSLPLNNFYLLLLNPEKVEHLQLIYYPHKHYIYTLDYQLNWQQQEANS